MNQQNHFFFSKKIQFDKQNKFTKKKGKEKFFKQRQNPSSRSTFFLRIRRSAIRINFNIYGKVYWEKNQSTAKQPSRKVNTILVSKLTETNLFTLIILDKKKNHHLCVVVFKSRFINKQTTKIKFGKQKISNLFSSETFLFLERERGSNEKNTFSRFINSNIHSVFRIIFEEKKRKM